MIRRAKQEDISKIMEIWLDTNKKAHDFIPLDYWSRNYEMVESMMHEAELYVDERNEIICGFIGLIKNYIAGIFVAEPYQSAGMGKALLDYVKKQKKELILHVYSKNEGALRFYFREGFVKIKEQLEEENGMPEYEMRWHR